MSDQNNDSQAEIVDDGLDNLPESDKKETQEIIDEIKEEDKSDEKDEDKSDDQKSDKSEEDDSKKDDKSDDDKSDDKGKDDDKGSDDDKDDDKEPPRGKSKLMPEWVHKRALSEKEGIIKDLEEKLKDKSEDKSNDGEEKSEDGAKSADLEKEIKEVAEKHELDPALVKSLVELGMKHGGKIPAEITEKLASLDKINEEREISAEEQAFSTNFDKHVVPLIKGEYGDKVTPDTIEAIKEKLKAEAYTEKYKTTPYSVIYKGIDDFRKFSRKPEGSGEGSRGGFHQNGGGEKSDSIDFDSLTDDEISKLDGPTFDKYSAHMEAKEHNRNQSHG